MLTLLTQGFASMKTHRMNILLLIAIRKLKMVGYWAVDQVMASKWGPHWEKSWQTSLLDKNRLIRFLH